MDSGAEDREPQKERPLIFDIKTMHEVLSNFNIKVTLKDLKQPNVTKFFLLFNTFVLLIFNCLSLQLKIETLMVLYKGFIDTCLAHNSFDTDPQDICLHFNDDDIKNQSEAFRFMQLYSLTYEHFLLQLFQSYFN